MDSHPLDPLSTRTRAQPATTREFLATLAAVDVAPTALKSLAQAVSAHIQGNPALAQAGPSHSDGACPNANAMRPRLRPSKKHAPPRPLPLSALIKKAQSRTTTLFLPGLLQTDLQSLYLDFPSCVLSISLDILSRDPTLSNPQHSDCPLTRECPREPPRPTHV